VLRQQKRQDRKIVWLILDAAGYEITTRCIRAGVCPSLTSIQEQGYLGPSQAPEPNCETPPALRALFSGSAPAESGIWGPHPLRAASGDIRCPTMAAGSIAALAVSACP
jgi:predicted AlkP superfamily phosphohydrolase/phosphomutase